VARRGAAFIALVAAPLSVLYLVLEGFDEWYVLVVGIPSLAVVVLGAWYLLSRRGAMRLLAACLVGGGLIAFIIVTIAGQLLRVLVASGALAAIAIAAAGYALRVRSTETKASGAPRAKQPVLIMNLKSGGGKAERFHLVDQCRERGIEPIVLTPGTDLLELAEDAVARGADVIGMAGGDGSQALVASVASRHGIPHVVIPAGTRNHFALDLGLDRDDVVGALDAYSDGVDRTIDLGRGERPGLREQRVDGRVCESRSVPRISRREGADRRSHAARDHRPLTRRRWTSGSPAPSGEELPTSQLILVSNNPYDLQDLRSAGTRARIDGGTLGIVAVQVRGGADAEKLVALQSVGQAQRFSGWHQWQATEFEVRSAEPVEIGVDGEALTLPPPLRFRIRPGALTVRLPRSAGLSPAARAVRIASRSTFTALWHIAVGRPS
jgi:diacylglycerol kinase family enzyme